MRRNVQWDLSLQVKAEVIEEEVVAHQLPRYSPDDCCFHCSQKLDSINHLFGCDNICIEGESPDAFT